MLLKYHSGEVERKTTSINKGPWNWRSFRAFPSYYLGKQTCLCVLRCRTQVDPLQEHQPHLQPLWELTNHRKPQQKTKGKTDPRPWPDMTPTHCYYLGQWHAPHKDLESPTAKKKVWVRLHIVFSFSMFVVLTIKVPFAFWSLNCAHLSFIHHHCTFSGYSEVTPSHTIQAWRVTPENPRTAAPIQAPRVLHPCLYLRENHFAARILATLVTHPHSSASFIPILLCTIYQLWLLKGTRDLYQETLNIEIILCKHLPLLKEGEETKKPFFFDLAGNNLLNKWMRKNENHKVITNRKDMNTKLKQSFNQYKVQKSSNWPLFLVL